MKVTVLIFMLYASYALAQSTSSAPSGGAGDYGDEYGEEAKDKNFVIGEWFDEHGDIWNEVPYLTMLDDDKNLMLENADGTMKFLERDDYSRIDEVNGDQEFHHDSRVQRNADGSRVRAHYEDHQDERDEHDNHYRNPITNWQKWNPFNFFHHEDINTNTYDDHDNGDNDDDDDDRREKREGRRETDKKQLMILFKIMMMTSSITMSNGKTGKKNVRTNVTADLMIMMMKLI